MINQTEILQRLKTPVWVYCFENKSIVWANKAALTFWEAKDTDEIKNRNIGSGMSLATSATLDFFRSQFEDGESISTWWHYTPKNSEKKAMCHFSGISLGKTRAGMLVEVLAEEESIHHAAAFSDHSNNAILLNHDGKILSYNKALTQYYSPTVKTLSEFTACEVTTVDWLKRVQKNKTVQTVHHCFTGHDSYWFNIEMHWLEDSHQILMHLTNIDEERHSYLETQYASNHDLLTKLLSRKGLHRILEADTESNEFDILFIDIDGFKSVNDSYGHIAGDQLLIAIAHRISNLLPQTAKLARFSGDEFIIYTKNKDPQLAERIIKQCNRPFTIEGAGSLNIGCSIGIASFPEHSQDMKQIFQFADIAMLSAKKSGRNRAHFFEPSMLEEIHYKILLRKQLDEAIKQRNFNLHYQPIYDINSHVIISVEALLRWHDPILGHVSPASFIPFAEECGLMPEVGLWVIESACKQLNEWNKTRYWVVHINLSPCQLNDSFINDVEEIVHRYDIKPQQLVFEITETAIVENEAVVQSRLQELSQHGYSIQLDDFGSGYANLDRITSLPLTAIKLDRQFISADTVPNRAIIKATQLICEACNYTLIAEGVETEEQLHKIKELNISQCQGFLLCKPVPPEQLDNINTIPSAYYTRNEAKPILEC